LLAASVGCNWFESGNQDTRTERERTERSRDPVDTTPDNDNRDDRQTERPGISEPVDLSNYGQIAISYIEHMSENLYDRFPFSYREKETALWIVDELIGMGYSPDDIEVQEFHHTAVRRWLWGTWEDTMRWQFAGGGDYLEYSQNVILTVPGRVESTIIVGAHYDSLLYPGASDNASGSALILESAARMIDQDNYHTIVYVFFGAEEIGLLGAFYYYESLTRQQRNNIVFMVNSDVLLEGDYVVYGVGHLAAGQMATNDLSRQVSAISQGLRDEHEVQISTYLPAINMSSDQLVFLHNGHTVVFFVGVHLHPRGSPYNGIHLADYGDYIMTGRVFHSNEDSYAYISETWPEMLEENMWIFSVFLEQMLLTKYIL